LDFLVKHQGRMMRDTRGLLQIDDFARAWCRCSREVLTHQGVLEMMKD